ncbi:MAG TPA: arsenate reductase ArsC [Longilinea sp.]|nr:arsenate reductase ArsC [Longilinea sp.]
MEKTRVLFLCSHNSARSQMAEALLRHYAGDQFDAYSAGLEASEINPMTRQVINELAIDMRGQYSKPLTTYIGKTHFDYLITVCSKAEERCPIFPGMGVRLHWQFDDPAAFNGTEEQKLDEFRRVRDQIQSRVQAWIADQNASAGAEIWPMMNHT